ncbi:ABC transporter [Marinitoga sp. 1135]|uniref:Lipopolysaccharide export system ATP-binding protein LptB n=1 Tax=Marinitoga piezophila (strain DSM 14283 / JCM 11233 / KA3) TaxID=443254 RepID=H2J3X6_MARPK|nr:MULTISPECIES: LPS export ABC transporter ATP-binding protein [Marinitoga]AEX84704.1 ABC-type (unclassified) transport system, ATPase component [Marinitoga piezophila KA3]APT75230.1 ABC transporter [Marinitoga sp. 1137]NUU95009.1 ABC transporter [Marinitoga sp. 1135]NUU96965.1 ABC transporter [Marinitoga sp. 1138]
MEKHTLVCKKIIKKYGRKIVLNGVDFEAGTGEIVGILGPNGAGKSTLFKTILGIVVPKSGEVLLDNIKITHLPVHIRAKNGIAYLPQEPSVFRNLTVWDNMDLIASMLKIENKEKIITDILSEFGILELKNQIADSLSGGEKRRLEFARTLLMKPKFILLDEPFVGIDPITVKDIQKIIKSLSKRGLGVIVTDHNVDEIAEVVDILYVVHKGNVIAHGKPEEVLKDEKVIENYLGW